MNFLLLSFINKMEDIFVNRTLKSHDSVIKICRNEVKQKICERALEFRKHDRSIRCLSLYALTFRPPKLSFNFLSGDVRLGKDFTPQCGSNSTFFFSLKDDFLIKLLIINLCHLVMGFEGRKTSKSTKFILPVR